MMLVVLLYESFIFLVLSSAEMNLLYVQWFFVAPQNLLCIQKRALRVSIIVKFRFLYRKFDLSDWMIF